jgi:hypothetical protein
MRHTKSAILYPCIEPDNKIEANEGYFGSQKRVPGAIIICGLLDSTSTQLFETGPVTNSNVLKSHAAKESFHILQVDHPTLLQCPIGEIRFSKKI